MSARTADVRWFHMILRLIEIAPYLAGLAVESIPLW